MKRKILLAACCCTAVLITALAVLTKYFPGLFSSMMAFPFEQLGFGLGVLSKTGPFGNGAAAAVWIGISAIPAMIALRYKKGKETVPERVSLYVLSLAVLAALYGMVNPQRFYFAPPEAFPEYSKLIKAVFGVSVWAVVVLYLVLRLIRLFRRGNQEQLLKYMRAILYVLCLIIAGAAALSVTSGVIELVDTAQAAADAGFGAFRLLVRLSPYVLDILVILRVMDLLDAVKSEKQDAVVESAGRVSGTCCLALGITTAGTALSNIMQIALMRQLSNISVTVDIPIVSIAFTVMILLLSRLLIENKILRDDNSLFI